MRCFPLYKLLPFVDIHDSDLKLNEVLLDQEWKWDSMYTLIPEHIKQFLQNSQIHLNSATQDRFIWNNSPDGTYTVKAGFQWILNQRMGNSREHSWKWIWNIPAQENIKLFCWLAFHNSIPTLFTLHRRGITTTAVCKICLSEEETLLHCIRDCPRIKKIWERLGFRDSFFHQLDANIWLKQGATGINDTLFISCVWWAWKARNAFCFNSESIPFTRLLLSILNL